jgi:hypothetical protein
VAAQELDRHLDLQRSSSNKALGFLSQQLAAYFGHWNHLQPGLSGLSATGLPHSISGSKPLENDAVSELHK